MSLIRFHLPLATLALCVATVSAAASLEQAVKASRDEPRRTLHVVARGRLNGTRELQQVVTWQTSGTAHLAIETLGTRPRLLWQTDGGNAESRVDSVRVADLDGDGLPEIVSLWWKDSSPSAVLRVAHWDRRQSSFVELQFEGEVNRVQSYRVARVAGSRASNRLVVESRSDSNARRSTGPGVEYELQGSKLVRVGGGREVTTQGESGIEGQSVISPAHPGPVREGMSDSAPYKTTLVVWRLDGDREVTRFETGSDGRFRVALPPGTYRVGPPPQTGRFLPRAAEETVTVAPGKFVRVTINFDSGMR
jgi:hypothetical protein